MTTDVIEQHLLPSIQLFQEEHPEYNRLDDHGNEVSPYQGIAPSGGSIWLTPMLFMGVLLKWYGFKAAHVVVQSFEDLVEIDKELMQADKGIWYGNIKKQAEKCNSLNLKLTKLNTSLIGLRSRVNYVADTTRDMVTDICTMTKFVTDELNGGDYDKICPRKFLKQALKLLDSSKFVKRDNDKFDLTARTMQQYSVDIKSLKAHMTINIGLVSYF